MAGVLVEARHKPSSEGDGTVRFGALGDLEPSPLDLQYVSGVRKAGGYVAYDGPGPRRHVLGYVQVRNESVIERSVLTTANFCRSAGRSTSTRPANTT
jgi:hypothetical protein